MNQKEEIKSYLDQVRNENKNNYKRENYPEKMNEESIQYIERTITNDHVDRTSL